MSLGLAESFNYPHYLPAYVVNAKTTNMARRLLARSSWDGTVVKAVSFSVGSGGYDPVDYARALSVNPDAADLDATVYSAPLTKIEWANQNCSSYYCLLPSAAFSSCLGEIGIFSTIVASPIAVEVGTTFMSAIGNFPLRVKNTSMQMAIRVLRQS